MPMKRSLWRPVLTTVGIYLVFGVLWIALTDPILHALIPDSDQLLRLEIYKGWFFVVATDSLLTFVLYRQFKARYQALSEVELSHEKLRIAYQDLQEGEDRFRATFEQPAVGIAYVDMKDRLLLFNKKWSSLLEYIPEDLYRIQSVDLIHPADLASYQSTQGDIMTTHDPSNSVNLRMVKKDGKSVCMNMVLTLVYDENGQPSYWIYVINDVSRLINAEQELRKLNDDLENRVEQRTSQLVKANRELEDFAYSISHDLRAPLRAISGYSAILHEDYQQVLDQNGKDMLNNIAQASARMNILIDDLLKYARLGRKSLELVNIHFLDVLHIVQADLAIRIKDSRAQIIIPAEFDGLEIFGDVTLLHQVFENLLDNAMKYQAPGNQPIIKLSAEKKADQVLIRIRDKGIGITEEQYDRIFNIFHRLQQDDVYPGTGIGLAIVKKAIELLQGSVWVEPQPGQGTCFCIQLNQGKQDDLGQL
jgi:PAS domain S-box-containing protein